MEAFKDDDTYLVKHDDISVEDRIAVILEILSASEYATFQQLFADIRVKIVAVVTFLAILEMTKNHRITIRQALPFSEIRIYPTDRLQQTISPLPALDAVPIGDIEPSTEKAVTD
jgi:chromatin segregation and condensation protein Rec8/ScpA/Scc1 (kleisin family)